jgi:hypothetical protein
LDLLQAVQPQPQARSSIEEAPVSAQSAFPPQSTAPAPQSPVTSQSSSPQSAVPPQSAETPPQSPVMSRSSFPDIPVESHMVQTQPTEEEAGLNNVEDTGYSAIALYDYQAGWISPDV